MQGIAQLYPRLVQLRLAVTDGTIEHGGNLVMLVAFDVMENEDQPITGWQAVDSALKIDPSNSQGLELRKNLVAGQAQH